MIMATIGPAGTYSEVAAGIYASRKGGARAELVFQPPERCLSLVEDGRADAAVLPAENMVDGMIGATFDALINHYRAVGIVDEINLRVEHVLAARNSSSLSGINRVYSHPSALNQCARNLFAMLPQAATIPVGSTAEAAERVADSGGECAAAICSLPAAESRGLAILAKDFSDYQDNQTRFFVCSRGEATPTGDDRTHLAVRFGRNEPGQLFLVAGAFAGRGVDLTSVHSRPYKIRPQEYVLLFELSGHSTDPAVKGAIEDITPKVMQTGGWLIVLGSYPRRGVS